MTSLSVVEQMKEFPILIIIGVAFIAGILGIIIKYANIMPNLRGELQEVIKQ